MSMRWLRWLGIALLAVGIGLIAASVTTGEGQLILILFIPVFIGGGPFGLLGILAIFVGLFLATASVMWTPAAFHEQQEYIGPTARTSPPPTTPTGTSTKRFGGVVMIGPIPIVFGSDQKVVKWMIVLGFVLLALTLIVWLLFIRGFP